MNKSESKYFRTAAKMDEALIRLLEKKDFEYITVKELCEQAGVNRSTFYLHYENTSELLEEATRYTLDQFLKYFSDETQVRFSFESCDPDRLIFVTPAYIIPYLTYIKENKRVFQTALKHLGTMGFDAYYARMFRFIFDPILERFHIPQANRQYVMKFYLTGITAIAMEWLQNGCKDPAEKVCKIIMSCTVGEYARNETK